MRTIYQLTCQQCGRVYETTNKRQKFCSHRCSCDRLRGKQKRTQLYACKNCGKEFRPKVNNRIKYCSRQCAFEDLTKQAAINKAEKEQKRIETWPKCKVCGQPVKERRQGFCSDECRRESNRRWNRKFNEKKKALTPKTCKECGKVFTPEYGNKKRLFCSVHCKKKYGKKLIKPDTKRRGRARKYTNEIEMFRATEIYARDNWICQICNNPIDTTKGPKHSHAATIDHIVPLSRGGTHRRDNVQCAHRICNSKKGNAVSEHLIGIDLMA